MGDGTEKNPYTRDDILRLIKENGDTAEGLDLSGKNLAGIDLSNLNLGSVILQGAYLPDANLQGTLLPNANLQDAFAVNANLRGASLWFANLEGAYLSHAELYDAMLDEIKWGPQYIMGEENAGDFLHAKEVYRILKKSLQEAGMYDLAGEFFYREMEARRKDLKSRKPFQIHRLWLELFRFLCGYGERPLRVIVWAAAVVFGLAFIYFGIDSAREWRFFGDYLYFSAVSFTALGYGSWLRVTNDWIRGIGAFESFIGVFMIALFLVTFTRKMTR